MKPGLFKNAGLADLPMGATVLFVGLLAIADREGRLPDNPRLIRAEVFPMRDDVATADVEAWLAALAEHQERFVVRYQAGERRYLAIRNWHRHQRPHWREAASTIPPPPGVVGLNPEEKQDVGSSGNLDLFSDHASPKNDRTTAEGCVQDSGSNPSESESESECNAPAKDARRTNHPSAKDARTTAEPSGNWLSPYLAAWDEIRGGHLAPGKAARHLKPVDDRYGPEVGVAGWRAYLKSRADRDAAPAYFAEDAGRWCGGARPAPGATGERALAHGWVRPPDWPQGQPAFTWECECPSGQHVAFVQQLVGTCPAKLGLRVDGFGRVAA